VDHYYGSANRSVLLVKQHTLFQLVFFSCYILFTARIPKTMFVSFPAALVA
jgi:hypothetical protein